MDRHNTDSTKVIQAIFSIIPDAKLIWNDNDFDDIQWLEGNSESLPSWETIDAKITELENAEPLKLLREVRNAKLAETDWEIVMHKEKGTNIPTALKTYRQALRDITDTYTSLNDVVWPEKP